MNALLLAAEPTRAERIGFMVGSTFGIVCCLAFVLGGGGLFLFLLLKKEKPPK